MAGILLGLQTNEWVEGKKDRQMEEFYLQELLADMRKDSIEFNNVLLYVKEAEKNARLAHHYLEQRHESMDTLEFINAFKSSASFHMGAFPSMTWENLANTGNIKFIRNRGVLRSLYDYHASRNNVFSVVLSEFNFELKALHDYDKVHFSIPDQNDFFREFKLDTLHDKNVIPKLIGDLKSKELMKRLIVAHTVFQHNLELLCASTNECIRSLQGELMSGHF